MKYGATQTRACGYIRCDVVSYARLIVLIRRACVRAYQMGLGKTIQCIALLGQLQATGDQKPHLIVAPVSLLANWKRELGLWLPEAHVETYHGSQKEREEMRERLKAQRPRRMIMIAAYGTWQSQSADAKKERKWLNRFNWGYVVLDEGHCIKNAKSARHQRLSQVPSQNRL